MDTFSVICDRSGDCDVFTAALLRKTWRALTGFDCGAFAVDCRVRFCPAGIRKSLGSGTGIGIRKSLGPGTGTGIGKSLGPGTGTGTGIGKSLGPGTGIGKSLGPARLELPAILILITVYILICQSTKTI